MPGIPYQNNLTYRNFYGYQGGLGFETVEQVAPFNDTVTIDLTEGYVSQLRATLNGVLDYPTWTLTGSTAVQTLPSPYYPTAETGISGLLVASNGMITTTGQLGIGLYTISGTMIDALKNTGTWEYSLNVINVLTPTTTITPGVPKSPSGIEMAVPFQIDECTGGVAVVSGYNVIDAQHVKTIILTALNERVMLPTYGSLVESALFGPIDDNSRGLLQSDIRQAVEAWESAVNVASVKVTSDPQSQSTLDVIVEYSVAPSSDVNIVS